MQRSVSVVVRWHTMRTSLAEHCKTVVLLGELHRAQLLRHTLAPVLADGGYQVLIIEPGTDHPSPTVATMAADAAALIERRGLGPCAVVGDSLGALVAQELAVTRPELASCAVFSAARTAPSALYRGVHAEIIGRLETGALLRPEPLALLRALQLFSPSKLADNEYMNRALRLLHELPPEQPADAALVRAALEHEVRRDRLSAVTVPCLVLGYEHDAITPAHQARELASWIPGAQLRVLDLGHGGAIEDAWQVGHAITSFMVALTAAP